MVTAAMIAMFYLGTASGVVGAVLLGATRSPEHATAERTVEDTPPEADELEQAA